MFQKSVYTSRKTDGVFRPLLWRGRGGCVFRICSFDAIRSNTQYVKVSTHFCENLKHAGVTTENVAVCSESKIHSRTSRKTRISILESEYNPGKSSTSIEGRLMPIFYRGAGAGTYWHRNDARLSGFTPQAPGVVPSINRLINHVSRGTVYSPYISLTRSYGVALNYAVLPGQAIATRANPGYVYEIEIDEPLPPGLQLLDPVKEVAAVVPSPLSLVPYQHDGRPDFLLGVVNPKRMRRFLTAPCPQPPPGGGTSRPPNLTIELETLVRALRDAEILAVGNIPAACIRNRFDVS